MYFILLTIFSLVSIGLIVLIILQQSSGTDISNQFRSEGISNAIFHVPSFNTCIVRATIILAILFFILSLILSNLSGN